MKAICELEIILRMKRDLLEKTDAEILSLWTEYELRMGLVTDVLFTSGGKRQHAIERKINAELIDGRTLEDLENSLKHP